MQLGKIAAAADVPDGPTGTTTNPLHRQDSDTLPEPASPTHGPAHTDSGIFGKDVFSPRFTVGHVNVNVNQLLKGIAQSTRTGRAGAVKNTVRFAQVRLHVQKGFATATSVSFSPFGHLHSRARGRSASVVPQAGLAGPLVTLVSRYVGDDASRALHQKIATTATINTSAGHVDSAPVGSAAVVQVRVLVGCLLWRVVQACEGRAEEALLYA